jgi:hypothetical protein
MTMAEALLKEEREHKAGTEAEIAGGKDTAGLGIELTVRHAHGKTP